MTDNFFLNFLFNIRGALFESEIGRIFIFWFPKMSVLASIGLVVAIIDTWRKNWPMEPRIGSIREPVQKRKTAKIARDVWVNVLKRAEKGTEQDLAFAIIEADKLVDTVLKSGGFPGDTMAERLKRINENQLKSIDDLWRAHKVRNEIVHTPDFRITDEDAKKVLRDYQIVLQELEVI